MFFIVKNDGERLHGFYDIFSTGFWSDLQIDHFSIFQPGVALIRRALFWRLGPCHNGLHDEQSENEAKGLFHVDISILTSVLSRQRAAGSHIFTLFGSHHLSLSLGRAQSDWQRRRCNQISPDLLAFLCFFRGFNAYLVRKFLTQTPRSSGFLHYPSVPSPVSSTRRPQGAIPFVPEHHLPKHGWACGHCLPTRCEKVRCRSPWPCR